jgi:hypothetical protein
MTTAMRRITPDKGRDESGRRYLDNGQGQEFCGLVLVKKMAALTAAGSPSVSAVCAAQ